MTDQIRPYGPGKFSTYLDAYVYEVSLNGMTDDEVQDESGSWQGLMRNGRTIFKDHDPSLVSLNEAEREKLTSCAGVIIREDSDGFVAIHYYATTEELDAAWDAIREASDDDY